MSKERAYTIFSSDIEPPIITPEILSTKNEYLELISLLPDIEDELYNEISFKNQIKEFDFKEDIFDDNPFEDNSIEEIPYKNSTKPNLTIALKAMDYASQFIGSKYSWGGVSPKTGFDCSGIGYHSFRQFGINMPRTAKEMASFGIEVPIDLVLKGDWIVTKGNGKSGHHVVWVLGKNNDGSIRVLNAKGAKYGVIEDTFTNYKNILAVRRLSLSDTLKITPSFNTRKDYARTMYLYLYLALQNNGINGSIWAPVLVAHTAIESGWGNLFSRKNNNFGGIKGKGSGKTATKEYIPGLGYVTISDSFKSYPSIESFADNYVRMLKDKFKAFNGDPSLYLSNLKEHNYFTAQLSDYLKIFNPVLASVYLYLKN